MSTVTCTVILVLTIGRIKPGAGNRNQARVIRFRLVFFFAAVFFAVFFFAVFFLAVFFLPEVVPFANAVLFLSLTLFLDFRKSASALQV